MSMEFNEAEKLGLTKAIYGRRDVRNFRPAPVSKKILKKILEAGHNAPSVGFSQPWNFFLISNSDTKKLVYDHFTKENKKVIHSMQGDRSETYASLKLQGLLDSPHHLVVTCNQERNPDNRLGRTTVTDSDIYSTCLAIQNIWLTARSEGIGIGWMSIYDPIELPKLLKIPEEYKIIAYLCLGYPVDFPDNPILESTGWARRENLSDLVFEEEWGEASNIFTNDSEKKSTQLQNNFINTNNFEFDPEAFLERMNSLTKPMGSLGELEKIAFQLARIQNTNHPTIQNKAVLIVAGDHSVAAENISAYSQDTTYKMVYQYLAGGGAISSLTRGVGAKLYIADLGVNHSFATHANLIGKKIRMGTRNFLQEDALTLDEVNSAIEVGKNLWNEMDSSIDVLSLGEVGIGNTTVSVILACFFYDLDPEEIVGRGTGIDDSQLRKKISVVGTALKKFKKRVVNSESPGIEALVAVGGLEIAGMVGVILGAKNIPIAIVLDGLISTMAAVIALKIDSSLRDKLLFGHLSFEKAHKLVLDRLGVKPILDLQLRLGEATGSTLAISILEQSVRFVDEMKTWDEVNWNRLDQHK
ncbi:nicotinate-nucleotide--dimethylbenzimidazole phosphoribosyltransferase [Leptospira sp. GIMC2001]|uniref:nicotinate-nucleotide--dimethylbenzimidazole phosphoribosyltransferase n=1 Tax=Leptospira sp. GIMC2001 TaxID=1513297 RepID=UPI00234BA4DC|nr:nicotinate-nucleotide--dimethylbenzimidazole phosphoribosyltransferase [Leptospira sp. GIMC2001]WCL50872.1 nicotinate-nucleotide--dimethylbenzimidazole phosphoribosyltransferase [Leptospira sp. GIMC2001]